MHLADMRQKTHQNAPDCDEERDDKQQDTPIWELEHSRGLTGYIHKAKSEMFSLCAIMRENTYSAQPVVSGNLRHQEPEERMVCAQFSYMALTHRMTYRGGTVSSRSLAPWEELASSTLEAISIPHM
jgi:hypothetical protein